MRVVRNVPCCAMLSGPHTSALTSGMQASSRIRDHGHTVLHGVGIRSSGILSLLEMSVPEVPQEELRDQSNMCIYVDSSILPMLAESAADLNSIHATSFESLPYTIFVHICRGCEWEWNAYPSLGRPGGDASSHPSFFGLSAGIQVSNKKPVLCNWTHNEPIPS